MKNKIISLCLVFVMLSTMFLFVGCKKEKTVKLSKAESEYHLINAINDVYNEDWIKIDSETSMGRVKSIASKDYYYSEKTFWVSSQIWTFNEGGVWTDYVKSSSKHTKSVSRDITGDPRIYAFDSIDTGYQYKEFSSSVKDKETITIIYTMNSDGKTIKLKYVLENYQLTTIIMDMGSTSLTTTISRGNSLMNEVPVRPTDVEWNELSPYLKVSGLKSDYVVGEELNLSDVYLTYYDCEGAIFPDVYLLTEKMITGFSTENAGDFTMTIKCGNLSLDFSYTVAEEVTGQAA